MKWQVGMTTVVGRNHAPSARSINIAMGFSPDVFSDGWPHIDDENYYELRDLTTIHQKYGVVGNWIVTAHELYIADPQADRYAIFQDDIRCCQNLRQYLETCLVPAKCYQNLILFPDNQTNGFGAALNHPEGTWYPAPKAGLGAQGLVFDNMAMRTLLKSPFLVEIFQQPVNAKDGIDGMISSVMANAGYAEYVHYPSLLDHMDVPSTLGHPPQPKIASFRGDEFDAMKLLNFTDK